MEDPAGRLSNPTSDSETAGQQGFSVVIRSVHDLPELGSEAWARYWLEEKGQLSNPRSELNQTVDLLTRAMQKIEARRKGQLRRRRAVTRQLSIAGVDQLVKQYQAGSSAQELAREFNVHRTTVLKHLENRGVPRRASTRKMTDEQAAEAKVMWEIGVSYSTIARKFGVSPRTAKREIEKV